MALKVNLPPPPKIGLIEMLYPSVGVLSFRFEISECSIDWVVESQMKCSQSYFILFQLNFSKNDLLIYSHLVNETDNVDQVYNFKKNHPLYCPYPMIHLI